MALDDSGLDKVTGGGRPIETTSARDTVESEDQFSDLLILYDAGKKKKKSNEPNLKDPILKEPESPELIKITFPKKDFDADEKIPAFLDPSSYK